MIQSPFKTDIYVTQYPETDELEPLLNEFIVDLPFSQLVNKTVYKRPPLPPGVDVTAQHWWKNDPNHQPEYLHKKIEFQKLVKFVEHHAKIYWDSIGYNPNLSPYLTNTWVQRYKGHTTGLGVHNHPNIAIVGIFYFDSSPEQGNLVLEDPLDLVLSNVPWASWGRNSKLYDIETNTGMLVLLPGWLRHSVMPNTTDRTRYCWSLEFNTIE